MKKVYLAGGMKDNDTRRYIKAHLKYIEEVEILDPNDWAGECREDPDLYTERDLRAIRECDFVVAFMTPCNPSGYGLSLEVGYAVGAGKRVLFFNALGEDWRGRYFRMIETVSDTVFSKIAFAELLMEYRG